MVQQIQTSTGLTDLPTEILLEICQDLDVQSIFYLTEVNKLFHNLIEINKASILLPVLQREFSPFEELVQLFTASEEDLNRHGATYQPRRVIFKRHISDTTGITLACGDFCTLASGNAFTGIRKNGKQTNAEPLLPPAVAVLYDRDIDSLLRYCLEVKKWEQRFPQLRFVKEPADCRWLTTDERHRLRRALYRWWLYAFYFHGDMPRPRRGLPEPYVNDIRTSQMRLYPTSELLELLDLVASYKDLILHYICPNLDQHVVCKSSTANGAADHNGDDPELCFPDDPIRRTRIVNTYAKLDPQELMHYFENLFSYPRKRLLTDIRIRHPTFTRDQESLQAAIKSALDERHWLDNLPSLATDSAGGILDFGDERDEERRIFGADASYDGSLPPPATYRPPHAEYSPRGDDGSIIDEDGLGYGVVGNRWMTSTASRRIAY